MKTDELKAAEVTVANMTDEMADQLILRVKRGEIISSDERHVHDLLQEARRRQRVVANQRKRETADAARGLYKVSFNGDEMTIHARDANEARAIWNDAKKASHGPKVPGWKVVKVG